MLSKTLAIVLCALTLSVSGAFAQPAPGSAPPASQPSEQTPVTTPQPPARGAPLRPDAGMANGMSACRVDMQTLCGAAGGQRGDRMQCLIANRNKVSPACEAVIAAIEQRGPRADRKAERAGRPGQACRGDMQALCGTVEQGQARQQCLRQNEAQLSLTCKEALAGLSSQRREMRVACRNERQTLCQGSNVTPGGMQRCLRDNLAQLSPTCSASLSTLPLPTKQ